jgi:hypothetical protein
MQLPVCLVVQFLRCDCLWLAPCICVCRWLRLYITHVLLRLRCSRDLRALKLIIVTVGVRALLELSNSKANTAQLYTLDGGMLKVKWTADDGLPAVLQQQAHLEIQAGVQHWQEEAVLLQKQVAAAACTAWRQQRVSWQAQSLYHKAGDQLLPTTASWWTVTAATAPGITVAQSARQHGWQLWMVPTRRHQQAQPQHQAQLPQLLASMGAVAAAAAAAAQACGRYCFKGAVGSSV